MKLTQKITAAFCLLLSIYGTSPNAYAKDKFEVGQAVLVDTYPCPRLANIVDIKNGLIATDDFKKDGTYLEAKFIKPYKPTQSFQHRTLSERILRQDGRTFVIDQQVLVDMYSGKKLAQITDLTEDGLVMTSFNSACYFDISEISPLEAE